MSTQPLLFSLLGRYALRTAAIVAECDHKITGKALAARTGIPPSYQSKVLRRLVEADILSAQKGHHGGFTMAHTPESIRLADVLAAVGALPIEGACVFGWGQCSALEPCTLHNNWKALSEQIMSWAEKSTLANITDRT